MFLAGIFKAMGQFSKFRGKFVYFLLLKICYKSLRRRKIIVLPRKKKSFQGKSYMCDVTVDVSIFFSRISL